jgi:hypothetical protein
MLPGAVSSVGRAPALQAGGRWFEPGTAHRFRRLQLTEIVFADDQPDCAEAAGLRIRARKE